MMAVKGKTPSEAAGIKVEGKQVADANSECKPEKDH
jgi:hypothetical protein